MVVESFGGWGGTALKVLKTMVQCNVALTGTSASIVASRLYSGLSIKIMRANARSLLARIVDGSHGGPSVVDGARTVLEMTA